MTKSPVRHELYRVFLPFPDAIAIYPRGRNVVSNQAILGQDPIQLKNILGMFLTDTNLIVIYYFAIVEGKRQRYSALINVSISVISRANMLSIVVQTMPLPHFTSCGRLGR